jgi:hypothetical protein
MGIEAALLVGGGLVGNYINSKGKQKAAAQQASGIRDATSQSLQTQERMFNQGQEATQGYRDRGEWAGDQYKGLMSPQGQGDFASQYTQGPMFQMFEKQAEKSALRNASATGGLRTGQTNVALASIAPQLIQKAYMDKLQGLNALQGYGANAAGQTASLATGVGSNMGNTQYQGGVAATNPQYDANTAMSNFYGDAVSTLGGVGYDAMSAPKLQPTQIYTRPGQTYGR